MVFFRAAVANNSLHQAGINVFLHIDGFVKKGSFNKAKCSLCHEYVFERYLRTKDGQPVCIPCSGYEAKT
jgi:formylmethanofuran dehydrogenase subunit E